MAARGGPVCNSSAVYADACVEHVLAFMLAQARQLVPGLASQCANGSEEWFRLRADSVPLGGQRVVILGFGVIAARLIEVLGPFGMEIVAMRRSPRGSEGVPTVTPGELEVPMSRADHVVNILPDNAESSHFMNAERFGWMKPGAVFYNIGRGGTVDQDALAEALVSGQVGAAWLDVTTPEPLPADHALRRAPNCHITPHTAGGYRGESEAVVRHFLENFRRFQEGGPLVDRIM
jgi:phosphoglycerate dehydrogenase-like enzyme